MRRFLLLSLLALVAMLVVGCAPHRPDLLRAPEATEVALAGILVGAQDTAARPLPDAVAARLSEQLAARDLLARPVPGAAEAFTARRVGSQRLAWMAEHADGAPILLMIEADAAFADQLAGRYRWLVSVTLTLAPANRPAEALVSEFRVPVFLLFDHEREAEALEAAGPAIERNLGFLLDEYLGALR